MWIECHVLKFLSRHSAVLQRVDSHLSTAGRRLLGLTVCSAFASAALAPAAPASIAPSSSAAGLAGAMSAQAGLVTGASWPAQESAANPSSATAAGTAQGFFGVYMPNDGPSFAAMTTGDVGIADPPNDSSSAGVDNEQTARNVHDLSVLKIDVAVPAGANCLSFDVVFYSEEYPEYVGSQYNDGFVAELDRNDWTYDSGLLEIDAPGNFAFDENENLLTVNSASFAAEDDTTLQYDGSTRLLTAATPVSPGAHSVYLSLFDAGDGIYDTAVFLDHLRAEDVPPGQCVAGARDRDTDGDALPDAWETEGYDADGDGSIDVDLPAMGADPLRRDLFVELDAMKGLRLSQAAIAKVTGAFAAAPLSNPDGSSGIDLHVDNGPSSTMDPQTGSTWGSRSRATDLGFIPELGFFDDDDEYDWGAFDTLKSNNFPDDREPIFHYALSANRYGDSESSGISRGIGASDFIVSLGTMCSPEGACPGPVSAQAGTFMHEFGHNLDLRHGGRDGVNNKPNYLSIMNYTFQFTGLLGSKGGFDYSRFDGFDLPALEESHLYEPGGFNTGLSGFLTLTNCDGGFFGDDHWQTVSIAAQVDFSCDGDFDDTDASEDLNRDGDQTTLHGFDDWSAIEPKGGSIGGNGLGALLPAATPAEEAPISEVAEISEAAVPPPSLLAGSVTGISSSRVDVQATVNPHGRPVEVAVQYGRGPSYGSQTPFQSVGAGDAPVAVAIPVAGLAGGAYHYQVIAQSPEHLVYSPDGVFTAAAATSSPPPAGPSFSPPVSGRAAVGVRLAAVRLSGKLLNRRHRMIVRFTLSQPAKVSLRVRRRSSKKGKTLSFSLPAGGNRIALGWHRLGLDPGRYRLRLQARAADGTVATSRTFGFRIGR